MAKVDQLFWPRYQSVRIIIILMRYARLKSKSTGIRVVQVDKMTFANAMLILIWGKSWNYLYSISSSRWRPPEDKKLKNLLSKIQQKPEKLLKFVVDSFFCWDLFQPLFAETRDEHIFFWIHWNSSHIHGFENYETANGSQEHSALCKPFLEFFLVLGFPFVHMILICCFSSSILLSGLSSLANHNVRYSNRNCSVFWPWEESSSTVKRVKSHLRWTSYWKNQK